MNTELIMIDKDMFYINKLQDKLRKNLDGICGNGVKIKVKKGNGMMNMVCTGSSGFGSNTGFILATSKNGKNHNIYYKDIVEISNKG